MLQVALECFRHIWDEHIIPQTKAAPQLQGQNPPVDQVGPVTFGGVLGYDIAMAPSTRWQLVACSRDRWVDRKDGRSDLDIVPVCCRSRARRSPLPAGAASPGTVCGGVSLAHLARPHILRIPCEEGELGQTPGG